jgi:dihydroorotase
MSQTLNKPNTMEDVLIRSAEILDSDSPHFKKRRDVLIQNGVIASIAESIEAKSVRVIEGKNLCISKGWIDLRANFRTPGDEHKETIESGLLAARAGGFRHVVLMPSTNPVIDQSSLLSFFHSKQSLGVHLHVAAALSHGLEGKQLSEMFDLHRAGAVAFTDDKKPVRMELLAKALEYSKVFGGLVMTFPFYSELRPGGIMHEGSVNVTLGLKGIPSEAEEMALRRDIDLLRYCGGRMHVSLISTSGSVKLIKEAKKEGLAITCGVAAHQLYYTEEALTTFDSQYKVLPPYRSEADRKALRKGVAEGIIDAVCSDHTPEDIEQTEREFEYASFGNSSIQNAFHQAYESMRFLMTPEKLVERFTAGPEQVLGITRKPIAEGNPADITVFSLEESTTFNEEQWHSLSKNNPWIGKTLSGRIYF